MKIGIALSGGGVRGASHIGVLKALEESNIKPDLISGSSSGSIVASLYAVGYSLNEIQNIFLKINKKILDFDIKGLFKFFGGLLLLKNFKIDGLMRGDKIEHLIMKLAKNKGIEKIADAKIPIAITSVDINTSQLTIFTSERLYDNRVIYNNNVKIWEAVRASISFPGIIKPKVINKKRMVDGGVGDGVPVKVLKRMRADKVIAVNLGYCGELKDEVDNIFEIINQTIDIMSYNVFKANSCEVDYLIKPRIYDVSLLEIDRINECITRGYDYTRQIIPDLKYKLGI